MRCCGPERPLLGEVPSGLPFKGARCAAWRGSPNRLCVSFASFFKKNLFIFIEREGERETSMCGCCLHPLLGIWPTLQACALTGNQTSNLPLCETVLSPWHHAGQGWCPLLCPPPWRAQGGEACAVLWPESLLSLPLSWGGTAGDVSLLATWGGGSWHLGCKGLVGRPSLLPAGCPSSLPTGPWGQRTSWEGTGRQQAALPP